jgi:mannose-6-phosphate isomerase-like protein (cupin superfamily)
MTLRLSLALLAAFVTQYPFFPGRTIQNPSLQQWENDRVRVRRIALAPGEALTDDRGGDAVLVYMTADLDGRMPPAEAAWYGGGSRELRNRGRARFEGLLVEFKNVAQRVSGATLPEAYGWPDVVDAWRLIENPQVTVIKQRLYPVTYYDSQHFHNEDVIVVYLGAGYTWPPVRTLGYYRVHRGDFDVVPANTLHSFANAGGDPLVFLVIAPK